MFTLKLRSKTYMIKSAWLALVIFLAQGLSGSAQGALTVNPMEAGVPARQVLAPVQGNADPTWVVNVTDMAAFPIPSPDPSGITYLPSTSTLLIVDGDVEEKTGDLPHFKNVNVWELTLGGVPFRTTNISKVPPTKVPMTNEPVGIAYNPDDGNYYVADPEGTNIYNVDPGLDNVVFTVDDSWIPMDTALHGNNDPQGITYNPMNQHIYVADGQGQEVYEYTTSGALTNHFDVGQYGVANPQSVEFNPDNGTLFVMSSHSSVRIIIECTTGGSLLQTFDISSSNATAPAGLAYAPASNGSGAMRFYIVDRGIDNVTDPMELDGRLIEMAIPVKVFLPLVVR